MKQYLELLHEIYTHGNVKADRTGTGTKSLFGKQMRFNLNEGFPLLTTKKVAFRLIVEELLWFLRGETNIKSLVAKDVHIWDEWADENGDLGPVYGSQWRSWPGEPQLMRADQLPRDYTADAFYSDDDNIGVAMIQPGIDQIANVVEQIKNNPNSRRLIVSAWNPAQVDRMKLPPCHCLFQFYVADKKLHCQLYQRSCDMFLGVPFNIASYALLTNMIAHQCDLGIGEFVWTGGDTHIYKTHFSQVELQLSRTPSVLPTLAMPHSKPNSIFEYRYEDFALLNYTPQEAIKAPVAV